MPILTIRIADKANTVKCDFIVFTPKFLLFKVVKKYIDKIEKSLISDEIQIRYILTWAWIFDSLCAFFTITFNVLSGGSVNGN